MRIGFTTARLSRHGGGVQTALQGLAGAMLDLDQSVCVFGVDDPSYNADRHTWDPVQVKACHPIGPTSFAFTPAMARAVQQYEPDVLHQHGIWTHASVIGNSWGKASGKARVISPHGMLSEQTMKHGRTLHKRVAMQAYEWKNLCSAGCLHALVDAELDAIRSLQLRNPICLIPNGVSMDFPRFALPESIDNIVGSGPYTLYLGRLIEYKGALAAIDAWRMLDTKVCGDHQLVIAGWGSPEEEKRVAEAADRTDRVSFIGGIFGDDKHALLANANAFLLPSGYEGLPMAVLEAMSHGVPALITTECNLPKALEEGAAWQVATDRETLASDITSFMALDDTEKNHMGEKGTHFARINYSWNSVAKQFVSVYQWLLGQGPQPTCVRLPD